MNWITSNEYLLFWWKSSQQVQLFVLHDIISWQNLKTVGMRLEDEHEMAIQWYVDICIDTRQSDTKQNSAKTAPTVWQTCLGININGSYSPWSFCTGWSIGSHSGASVISCSRGRFWHWALQALTCPFTAVQFGWIGRQSIICNCLQRWCLWTSWRHCSSWQ